MGFNGHDAISNIPKPKQLPQSKRFVSSAVVYENLLFKSQPRASVAYDKGQLFFELKKLTTKSGNLAKVIVYYTSSSISRSSILSLPILTERIVLDDSDVLDFKVKFDMPEISTNYSFYIVFMDSFGKPAYLNNSIFTLNILNFNIAPTIAIQTTPTVITSVSLNITEIELDDKSQKAISTGTKFDFNVTTVGGNIGVSYVQIELLDKENQTDFSIPSLEISGRWKPIDYHLVASSDVGLSGNFSFSRIINNIPKSVIRYYHKYRISFFDKNNNMISINNGIEVLYGSISQNVSGEYCFNFNSEQSLTSYPAGFQVFASSSGNLYDSSALNVAYGFDSSMIKIANYSNNFDIDISKLIVPKTNYFYAINTDGKGYIAFNNSDNEIVYATDNAVIAFDFKESLQSNTGVVPSVEVSDIENYVVYSKNDGITIADGQELQYPIVAEENVSVVVATTASDKTFTYTRKLNSDNITYTHSYYHGLRLIDTIISEDRFVSGYGNETYKSCIVLNNADIMITNPDALAFPGGKISSIFIYNKTIDEVQIKKHYYVDKFVSDTTNAITAPVAGLNATDIVALYDIDETSPLYNVFMANQNPKSILKYVVT